MRVLVIGMSARALAQSVAAAGHEPVALDSFGDSDLLEVASWRKYDKSKSIASFAAELGAEGTVFASGVENHPEIVKELERSGMIVFSSSVEAIRRARDLDVLDSVCMEHGICRPSTLHGWADVDMRPDAGTYLIKSIRSGAGTLIRTWLPGKDDPDPAKGEYLQEKIEGAPISAAFLAGDGNAVLWGISRQLAGEPALGASGYGWCGNVMPLSANEEEKRELLAELRRIVGVLAGTLGITGACSADFIHDGERLWLLEINPRISASFELVEAITGENAFMLHVDALSGRLPSGPKELLSAPFRGKGIVYASVDMTAPDTSGWRSMGRRDIPRSGSALPRGTPICTVITPPLESDEAVMAYLSSEARKIWGECLR